MENEKDILDKTYTLNSEKSYFDSNGFNLSAYLPAETSGNPYQYSAFDLSQMVDNVIINAVLVFMRMKDDLGDDLSGSDDDTNEVSSSFTIASLEKLSGLPGICNFEDKNTDALIILMHECAEDMPYKKSCAQAVYPLVASIYADVTTKGNFQMTLDVMGTGPKKTGLSSLPRK